MRKEGGARRPASCLWVVLGAWVCKRTKSNVVFTSPETDEGEETGDSEE